MIQRTRGTTGEEPQHARRYLTVEAIDGPQGGYISRTRTASGRPITLSSHADLDSVARWARFTGYGVYSKDEQIATELRRRGVAVNTSIADWGFQQGHHHL